jgi:addiction module RelE/StbE family toxin
MAYEVIWSDDAYADIDQIAAYIAKDSPYHAQRVVEQIIEKSRSLDQFPERGRVVPEIGNPALREVFVYSYRMIYEVTERQVHVLSVIHGARLMENVKPL